MKPLQVFIGYDKHEPIAFHVLSHSIMRRASHPVSVTPLYLPQLQAMAVYDRQRGPTESTEFSLTRFLTPYLSGWQGVSIFMDCDMLCLGDICQLERMALDEPYNDVFVVKHDYTPKTTTKFLGQKQTAYPCKNWSSVMVFNGHRSPVRRLMPSLVSTAQPRYLHRFEWADSVGELPLHWNHLVGEYVPNPSAKLVHFTLGGPWFHEYADCEYADLWREEARHAGLYVGNEEVIIPFDSTASQGGHHGQAEPEVQAEESTGKTSQEE